MAIQELNLATSEKQDEILNNLSIHGGTNFNNRQQLSSRVAEAHESTLVLDVTGKGILHSINNGNPGNGYKVSVRVDGGDIFYYQLGATSSISPVMGFNNSLEIYTSSTPSHNIIANYSLEV